MLPTEEEGDGEKEEAAAEEPAKRQQAAGIDDLLSQLSPEEQALIQVSSLWPLNGYSGLPLICPLSRVHLSLALQSCKYIKTTDLSH